MIFVFFFFFNMICELKIFKNIVTFLKKKKKTDTFYFYFFNFYLHRRIVWDFNLEFFFKGRKLKKKITTFSLNRI